MLPALFSLNCGPCTCILTRRPIYVAGPSLHTHLTPGCGRGLHGWVELGQIPGDFGHKPLETLAVQGASELFLGSHVPSGEVSVLWAALVDVLRVLVHPHLRHSLQILKETGRCKRQALRRVKEGRGCKRPVRLRSTFLSFFFFLRSTFLILCCIKCCSHTVFKPSIFQFFLINILRAL